jgi:predicted transcriptional regulator
VLENPGAHLREVARRCALPLGTTLYHLDRLESSGELAVRRDGRYKRYYGASAMGRHEKDVLSSLRHDAARRVVLALLAAGPAGLTQRELTQALDLSRSTVSFHAAQLTQHGLLRRQETRPERRYEVAEPATVAALLERYRASLQRAPGESLLFERALAAAPTPAAAPAAEATA